MRWEFLSRLDAFSPGERTAPQRMLRTDHGSVVSAAHWRNRRWKAGQGTRRCTWREAYEVLQACRCPANSRLVSLRSGSPEVPGSALGPTNSHSATARPSVWLRRTCFAAPLCPACCASDSGLTSTALATTSSDSPSGTTSLAVTETSNLGGMLLNRTRSRVPWCANPTPTSEPYPTSSASDLNAPAKPSFNEMVKLKDCAHSAGSSESGKLAG